MIIYIVYIFLLEGIVKNNNIFLNDIIFKICYELYETSSKKISDPLSLFTLKNIIEQYQQSPQFQTIPNDVIILVFSDKYQIIFNNYKNKINEIKKIK
jgi:hypothetical protein